MCRNLLSREDLLRDGSRARHLSFKESHGVPLSSAAQPSHPQPSSPRFSGVSLCSGLNPSVAWSASRAAPWRRLPPGGQANPCEASATWFLGLAWCLRSSRFRPLRAFLWLIYARGDEICVLSPNNLGDLSSISTLIRYLASGVAFWPGKFNSQPMRR